jgi:hypothetical protein
VEVGEKGLGQQGTGMEDGGSRMVDVGEEGVTEVDEEG